VPPTGTAAHPIDAFLHRAQQERSTIAAAPADRLAWLRRVTLDLTGLPPTIDEQTQFLADTSPEAYDTVVSRLLDSPQYGVRYARHWLDVLRYADVDERAPAARQLHLWRDWVIASLNQDIPYDDFVRAQITGQRHAARTLMTATGQRRRKPPRPDDFFALGFLARGATRGDNNDESIGTAAVETISTAFMAMTVGCAKCHDHFYDPIAQDDFFAMKALFDPLVLEPVNLATADQMLGYGEKLTAYEEQRERLEAELREIVQPYHDRLYEERVEMLPPDVQRIIRKPESARTAVEQKLADDYYPILRIDPPKLKEIMPAEVARRYDEQRRKIDRLQSPEELPTFYTVREDEARKHVTRYVLNSGDASRPETDRPVEPGFPLADIDPETMFREGRREGFVDWLTGPENPLFARVAVNRIWQWHFGRGLHDRPSDFGFLGGEPNHPELLDWLSAEFIAQGYSMKWLHRTIVTSDAYRRSSVVADSVTAAENHRSDPHNMTLWHFPLRRLDAETVWDSVHFVANELDLTVGGPSFVPSDVDQQSPVRRGAYMLRGYQESREVTPEFLRLFDVEDGRLPCPVRERSVTAPQSLWLLNASRVEVAARKVAKICWSESDSDPREAINQVYRHLLGRSPTEQEQTAAGEFLRDSADPERLAELCHVVLNLDEFLYVP
jgi:hypothetical protein